MDKNKAKTDKNEHENEKKVKSRSRGSLMIKESSKIQKLPLEIHKVAIMILNQSLKILVTSVPVLSGNYINGPLKE